MLWVPVHHQRIRASSSALAPSLATAGSFIGLPAVAEASAAARAPPSPLGPSPSSPASGGGVGGPLSQRSAYRGSRHFMSRRDNGDLAGQLFGVRGRGGA